MKLGLSTACGSFTHQPQDFNFVSEQQCTYVFKDSSHVVFLVNGDYKCGSHIPGLNGNGLEKVIFKNEKV